MRAYTLPEALLYGHGVERTFLCPVHGDSRPSASLNVVKQVWYCYTCGAHGGLTGENALIEPDYNEMKKWIEEITSDPTIYPETWLDRWDSGPVHEYWANRVGSRAARAFRLGFDPVAEAGTYPLRGAGGEVLGVVRRPLARDWDGPKYLYPKGIDISRLLFNYGSSGRVVVLVEGALDAIALWNVGVHAMAIYGAHISEEQVRLIDRLDPDYVYTAFDNDNAGWLAGREVERAFKHRAVGKLSWPASWGKDVGELSETRLKKVVSVLVSEDLSCVESQTCESSRTPAGNRLSSTRTSKPRRLRIVRTSA